MSENALLGLYGFRRFAALSRTPLTPDFVVELPQGMNLKGAQLAQVTLEGAILHGTDFTDANLSEAILSNSDLTGAELSGSNLEKADLRGSNLTSARLSSAQLFSANLENAKLGGADLSDADFRDAYLLGASMEDVNLENTRFPDAALPDSLAWLEAPASIEKLLRKRLSSYEGQITPDQWEAINQLRPKMMRAAKLAGLATGEESSDVASEILLRIVQTQQIDEFLELGDQAQRSHIYWYAKDLVRSREQRRATLISNVRNSPAYDFDSDETDIGDYFVALASSDASPFERVVIREIRDLLSPELWRLVEARYIYGFNLREIATQESSSLNSIHRRLSKAREIITKYFLNSA